MDEIRHYPQAHVPEHLTKLTVEKLPLEEAYYIEPGERDDYEAPALFVGPDNRLKMARDYAIDPADTEPMTPLGLVGIMRVPLMEPGTDRIRDVYIADLRFLDHHDLVDDTDMSETMLDQEAFMAWTESLEESITFDAFIATDHEFDIDDDAIPNGSMYGDPALYPFLKTLRQRTNALLCGFLDRQKQKDDQEDEAEEEPTPRTQKLGRRFLRWFLPHQKDETDDAEADTTPETPAAPVKKPAEPTTVRTND